MSSNENKDYKKDIALAAGGTGLAASSKNLILGKKRMYHGTSKKNWESIKENGLLSSKGGLGGAGEAIDNLGYIEASKGTVHATRSKSISKLYGKLVEMKSNGFDMQGEKPQNVFKELIKSKNKGKSIKINMDYDKYKGMKVDPDSTPFTDKSNTIARKFGKNMASKGAINITPEEITGSNTTMKKDLIAQ